MGDRGYGFGGGVTSVTIQDQYHGAVVLDVAGELGGGVASFVEAVGGRVVVGTGVGVVEINGVRRRTPPNQNICHGMRLCSLLADGAVCLVLE